MRAAGLALSDLRARVLARMDGHPELAALKPAEPRTRASLEQAETAARGICDKLKQQMPPGWGFILWLESFGPDGFATYLSSIERETAMRSLREWLARMETTPRTSEFVDDTQTSCWCCGERRSLVKVSGPHRSVELCIVCLKTQEKPK